MRDWGLASELFVRLIDGRSPSMFGSLQFLCFHLVAHVLHTITRAHIKYTDNAATHPPTHCSYLLSYTFRLRIPFI